jgi:hypothetical protein
MSDSRQGGQLHLNKSQDTHHFQLLKDMCVFAFALLTKALQVRRQSVNY